MQYAVCCVPVSAVRKEPAHTAEMVNQQLFGECCIVVENIYGWVKVRSKYDAYEGWCQASHLNEINEDQYSFKNEKLTAGYINRVNYDGKKMLVPLGSSVAAFKKNKAVWSNTKCIYKGKTWLPANEKITKKAIKYISGRYVNTPYLWGGKSAFGIDCSGFSQSVYKFLNIKLPRDSDQQAQSGETIELLQKALCGDLCFFNNPEGRITHVGILLNSHQVIHSSGKVRIDKIDEEGIINIDTRRHTHTLRLIKRHFKLMH